MSREPSPRHSSPRHSNTTSYDYDRLNRLVKLTDPLGQIESYTYDNNGNLKTKKDRNGVTTTNTYNGLNLLTNVSNSGGVMTYAYTATGAKSTESNDNVTTTYQYNDRGLLIKQTETSAGLTVIKDYTYDLAGNRISFKLTKNGTLEITQSYEYDDLNRLVTVKENGQTVTEYGYDRNGNRTSLTYSNGVTTSYAYNNANMVTSLTNNSGGNVISGYTYSYYLDGNQATKTENSGKTTSYDYDGLGRLVSEAEAGTQDPVTKVYTYDNSGNRDTLQVTGEQSYLTTYAYDPNNRLITEISDYGTYESTNSYTYDPNGNQLGKFETRIGEVEGVIEGLEVYKAGVPEENETYEVEINEYDTFNRLIKAITNTATAEYTYKVDGLRYSKTVDDQTTIHVWDGGMVALEVDGSGSTIDTYIRGINLIKSNTNGYYVYNAHGDVVELTDSSGVVTKSYVYDAFGVEKNIDAEDMNPFRYAGEYYDKETGSIYLRNRYYNPLIGRFSSEDPIRDGLNWYTYANGNPIFFIDPLGLAATLLTDLVDQFNSKDEFEFELTWNDYKKTATVTGGLKSTIVGDSRSGIRESLDFVNGVDGTEIKDGKMYITEESAAKFKRTYRYLIDPPLEETKVDYFQVAVNATVLHFGVIKPLQISAANSKVGSGGSGNTTKVGRWMSQAEYNKMVKTGKVQMSPNGNTSYVANPANPNAFKAASNGSIYVEFDVPTSSIYMAGNEYWGQIAGPGSLMDRYNLSKG